MKYLLIVLSICLLGFTGCTKGSVGCTIEQTIVSGVGPAIATGLQCSNEAAIEADLNAIIGKLNICTKVSERDNKLNKLPAPICSLFANLVLNGVASVAIPSAWGCSAANAKGLLNNLIVTACTSL